MLVNQEKVSIKLKRNKSLDEARENIKKLGSHSDGINNFIRRLALYQGLYYKIEIYKEKRIFGLPGRETEEIEWVAFVMGNFMDKEENIPCYLIPGYKLDKEDIEDILKGFGIEE